ncbi:MAG: 2-dehydropantoate 2-reductase [Acidobacteria bacterium]|nr:2-dehydropantoate 2-reductase [Acidobacteriota bacterium]
MTLSEPNLRITIVGSGAMACLFGARLARVASVTLTGSWAEGIEAIRTSGITVEEAGQETAARVPAILWGEPVEPADLAIVLVKAWQTERVAADIPRLLRPEGVALTLQNGLGNLEALGPRAILGVTYRGATLLGPGRVLAGGDGATWIAGAGWISDLLRAAGMAVETGAPAQIDGMLWGKLAANCGINALTALLRVPNGALLRIPDAAVLMKRAAKECAAVATAKGIELPFSDPAGRVCEVALLTASNRSSMLQDLLRGAPTECDAINGAVARWGKRLGVPAPVNEFLYRMVKAAASLAAVSPEGGVPVS